MDQWHWLELIQSALVGEKIGDRRGSTGTRRLIQQFVSQMTNIFWIDLQCTGASVDFILFSGMSDTRDLLRFFILNARSSKNLCYQTTRAIKIRRGTLSDEESVKKSNVFPDFPGYEPGNDFPDFPGYEPVQISFNAKSHY